MAMNKKEKKMIEDLKIFCALRFTEKVEKDVDPPTIEDVSGKIINGWNFNSYNMSAHKSCSSALSHSNDGWDKTRCQSPIKQFSSRLLAIKAMRNDIEYDCACKLRKIDIMIEQELNDNQR